MRGAGVHAVFVIVVQFLTICRGNSVVAAVSGSCHGVICDHILRMYKY